MATIPSIKGYIVAAHAEVLKKYLEQHRPDSKLLERRFAPGDLEILTGPINATSWYDVRMYGRLLEFLRDYLGDGEDQYLMEAGTRSAENLIRAGIHQQFEYLRRTQHSGFSDARERFQAFGRDLRLLATVTASILNFARVEVVVDPEHPDRWMIVHGGAEAYPEALCWTTQGFCNRMAEEHGAPGLWYWDRPQPDLIRFRMNRAV